MSTTFNKHQQAKQLERKQEVTLNGKKYRQVNMHRVTYNVSARAQTRAKAGAMVDRGANGGISGTDSRVITKHIDKQVDVGGIDNHQLVGLPMVTSGAVVDTNRGPAIMIMNQYARIENGRTIHLSAQMEHFRLDVNEKLMKIEGGRQHITTPDGYMIPIDIENGLPYMKMRPYTDQEWDDLPHFVVTSDEDWDHTVLDHTITDTDEWFDAVSDFDKGVMDSPFDETGNYRKREVAKHVVEDVRPEDEEDGDELVRPDSPVLMAMEPKCVKFIQESEAWDDGETSDGEPAAKHLDEDDEDNDDGCPALLPRTYSSMSIDSEDLDSDDDYEDNDDEEDFFDTK